MTMKTIKTVNIRGSITLDDGVDESSFWSSWESFLKQNKLQFKGTTTLQKELVVVDNSDEPELPLF